MVLRRKDYSLSDEQAALRESFRTLFDKTSGSARVRAAEPLGHDASLWAELTHQRLTAMGVPESLGGDGAGLVELALVAEEIGRRAVPVPFVENVVAARTLARLGGQDRLLNALLEDEAIATVALGTGHRRLVPGGAVASAVLARTDDGLVLVEGPSGQHVPNLASAPLAWWDVTGGSVVGPAEAFERTELEWQILTAAALVGLGQSALDLGVQYAKERDAFGTPIGAFQAIAHPLADAAIGIEGSRRLVWRAAWFADHEPELLGALAPTCFLAAAESAEQAGAVAIHTQGGFGFTLESDVQLFYRRAKGWALAGGDRRTILRQVADATLGRGQR